MEELPIGQLPAREAAPKVCETPGFTTARSAHRKVSDQNTRGLYPQTRPANGGRRRPSLALPAATCTSPEPPVLACCKGRNDRTTGVVGKRETHERKTARESFTLLDAGSPLDERARNLISDLYNQLHRRALVLPTDDGLDPKQRLRVDLTMTEVQCQPMSIRKRLTRKARPWATSCRALHQGRLAGPTPSVAAIRSLSCLGDSRNF